MDERLTAILPCNDLNAAQAFFERLGFKRDGSTRDDYRMMSDGRGGFIHLTRATEGWVEAGRNHSASIFTGTMLTIWLPNSPAISSGKMRQTINLGACTNSRSTVPTVFLSGSAGQQD